MNFVNHRAMKRKLQATLLAVSMFAGFGIHQLRGQELEFTEPEDIATIQVHSSVRRAVTPANRHRASQARPVATRGSQQRQQLSIEVEANDSSDVLLASNEHVPDSPIPIPEAAPVLIAPMQENAGPLPLAADQHQDSVMLHDELNPSQPWTMDSCDGFAGVGCGVDGCDGACGSAMCNSMGCHPWPGFSFINRLCNPVGFTCSLVNRMQFRVTSVQFWNTEANLPALATTDPTGAVTATNTLYGGTLLGGSQAGLRAELTYWIDSQRERALWLRLYDSGSNDANAFFSSNDRPVIARPFINQTANANTAQAVVVASLAPAVAGDLSINLKSMIEGGDLLMRNRISEDELVRTDFIWGFQQTRFAESLRIDTNILTGPVNDIEYFEAANQFNGGQIGLLRTARDGCWYFDGFAKIGLGNMNRKVYIDDFGTDGLLANNDFNGGTFEDDTFVMTPELGISAAYLLTNNLHFTIGYSYLRVPKVSRVQNALDSGLGVNLVPGTAPNRPAFNFVESNLNVQMLDLGLQYQY